VRLQGSRSQVELLEFDLGGVGSLDELLDDQQ